MLSKKIIFLSSFLLCNQLSAIDLGESTTLHGFGTLGGSYNTNGDFLYRENVFSNIGSSNDFSLATHTKLGLQLDTNLTDNLKATIQTVLYQKEKGQIDTDLDWAYLKYSPTEYLNFKLGRMKIPFFIFSDSSNINYTNIWTHVPKETVVSSVPVSSYNGLEAEFLFNLKEHNISLQTYFGEEKSEIIGALGGGTLDAEFKNAYGFSITDYYGDLKLRASYFAGDVKFRSNDLDTLLSTGRALRIPTINNYDLSNLDMNLFALGFTYQFDNIFLASEYTSVELDNKVIDDMKGWYISTGYQFDKFMPYITYAQSKQKVDYPINDIPILPEIYGGSKLYDGLNSTTQAFNYSQKSISLGLRYDIQKNLALKAQVDRIFFDENHRTMYIRSAEPKDGHLDVYSIALDFVF